MKKMQEQISKDMEKLSQQMDNMLSSMEMEAIEMSLENLRQIIDNVSIYSADQEEIYVTTNKILQNNPAFSAILLTQFKLNNDFKIIEDSIQQLLQKVPQLHQPITKELESIKSNSKRLYQMLEQRIRNEALKLQRFNINSANLLALYLAELKNQLDQQQKGSGKGKSSKKGKEQQMQDLKQQQQKLKKELEKLLEQMKDQSGNQKPGEQSEQIVKSLAEQEILNKMLQQLMNEKGISPESDQKLKEIKRLSDQNINDLINKQITPELLNRNQKILSRLLESEKSEREREQDNKRESNEGINKERQIPEELKQSIKNSEKFKDLLKKSDLNLRNYYKNLSNEYFRLINE
jgi:hypothetical protein